MTGKDKSPGNNVVALVEKSQPVRDLAVRRAIEYVMLHDAQRLEFGGQNRSGAKGTMDGTN